MKKILVILNPLIWCWNMFKYTAHLEGQRHNSSGYEHYDFNQDTPYFNNKTTEGNK
jgi:hypothetical protein